MGRRIRRQVRIHGAVQGVGFRYACEREAARLGLSGWVRNNDDGTVEAVFEGDREAVESMCRWCQDGPRHAEVDRVDVTDDEPQGDADFQIL